MPLEPQPETLPDANDDPADAGSAPAAKGPVTARPPTVLDPAATDAVSILIAMQFGAYAAMYHTVSAQFAAAHETFVKSLAMDATSDATGESGDASAAT
ncbi:hypothetical protein BST25_07375 [Mycobacterium heidelbergense]|uniref:PE domain-containing protein n=2 Tax=Mycobacterium heidelbergense TaxID=53376 RepID=A0A1X0DRF9_MYCHE|nr:hypothetical protein BST25_07375 [Mycobacterium heidelbergense]BBZ51469.1 hypothetical protein MHEI_31860 [Mycobacterium heidelbergense]